MGKLLERLLQMRHGPAMYLGRDSLLAVTNFIYGYESADQDAGLPCDGLRGFDQWVNLRMLLPPDRSVGWSSRISAAAGTTHRHTYPYARDAEQRACWLFFEWLEEFAADCAARGVEAIIAEHDAFEWPELVEDVEPAEDDEA
jgi:hypothetical protein